MDIRNLDSPQSVPFEESVEAAACSQSIVLASDLAIKHGTGDSAVQLHLLPALLACVLNITVAAAWRLAVEYIKEMVDCDHGTSASTCCLEEAFVAIPHDLFFFCEHNVWF